MGCDPQLGRRDETLHHRGGWAKPVDQLPHKVLQFRTARHPGEPPVEIDFRSPLGYVAGGNVCFDRQVDVHFDRRLRRQPLEVADRLIQQFAVEFVSDHGDVSALFGAEDIARSADLQVAHGNGEPRPHVAELLDRA